MEKEQLEKNIKKLCYLHCVFIDNKIYFKIYNQIDKKTVITAFEVVAFNTNKSYKIKKNTVKYLSEYCCYSVEYDKE